MLTLAEIAVSNWVLGLAVMGFFLICLLLVLTILIQRPQGGGLAGAFGSGAGSGQTAFGAKTGDALTMFTIAVFVLYILAAIGLNLYLKPSQVPADAAAATSTAPAEGTGGATTPATGTTSGTPTPAPETPQVPFQPPSNLTPAGTTEVKPAPTEPAPAQPAPTEPVPTQPAPTQPAPEQPKPATP